MRRSAASSAQVCEGLASLQFDEAEVAKKKKKKKLQSCLPLRRGGGAIVATERFILFNDIISQIQESPPKREDSRRETWA